MLNSRANFVFRKHIAFSCSIVLLAASCRSSAETRLDQKFYVGYDTNSPEIGPEMTITCGDRSVSLLNLLESLRSAFDDRLVANDLGDIGNVIDLEHPDLIGLKVIDGEVFIRYTFATFLDPTVLIPGEGGVLLIVQPCSHKVVDAVLFRYP